MKVLLSSLLVAGLTIVGQAQASCGQGCAPACGPVCVPQVCVHYETRVVTTCRPVWHEREETCTVNRIVPRVEVVNQQVCVNVPVWTTQKQIITVNRTVARCVERDVTTCQMVPVCVTDPCTGCTHTCCKPVTCVQKVRCTVLECVPEQREICVRCCSYRQETRNIQCRRVYCECRPETVVRKVRYCEMVPCQTTIRVPVCTPCCNTCCN